MTPQEIKEKAIEVGMNEIAANALSNRVWGGNLKQCVVGGKGSYQFGRNEIYVLCYFETEARKWEFDYVCNYKTGSIIRKNKAKYL